MKLGSNTFSKHLKTDQFSEPLIFWDTSFPAAIILEIGTRRDAAIYFAEKLLKDNVCIAFSTHLCSEMVNLIVINKVMLGEGLKSNKEAKKVIDKDPSIISSYIQDIHEAVDNFYGLLGLFKDRFYAILPTEPVVAKSIVEIKTKYKLNQGDAMHIGTMLTSQQRDIAAFDDDFYKVDGINIWCKY